ncbi:MAG: glycosyltransferase family 4 protein [Limisphaerales bacterium]
MRLLIVSYFFEAPAGGGVIVARLLAEQLRGRGHSVDVLCLAGCSEPQPGPLLRMTAPPGFRTRLDRLRQVLLFLNNPGFDRYFLRQALGLTAKTGPYDFILAQDFLGMRVAACLADHWRIPCGATLQDTLPQQVDVGARNPALKTILRTLSRARDRSLVRDLQAYDWLAAISRHVAASARVWLQPTLPAIPVIPNPVPEDFRRLAPPHPSDTPRFLFVGRLSPEKGVDLLVEAFRRLPSDHRLTIVGLKGSLSRKIAEIAAADPRIRIEPPSPYHAMPQVYGRHEIVCCPAMWDEPFGLTVLEGRASQRVVIGTRRGGLLEILEGYPRSLFFDADPADRDITVDRLTQALIKAPSLLGQPLDPAIENEFVRGMELPSVVDRYEELIRDAVACPRHKRGG